MSAGSRSDVEDQLEDGDLGLGHGWQPGGLPPFQILLRATSSNAEQCPSEPSALPDSNGIQSVKRSVNPLMKLTSKLGFSSKSKCVSKADDGIQESASDMVELGTSLKQQKLMFRRDIMNILHRRNVDLQQCGTSGLSVYNNHTSVQYSFPVTVVQNI